jgi:GDP-mannose 6-dehydrogenase
MRFFFVWILLICMEGQSIEPKKVVIFGAGYVGLVTGTCLSKYGHQITFIETNTEKVAFLQSRRIPFFEPQLEALFCQGIERGLIELRCALGQEMVDADMVFIAVPTPTSADGEPQVQAVKEVLGEIVASMDQRKHALIVSIRSTLLPDAFRELQKFCERQNSQITLVMNPEFLRESTAVRDFFYPPFCVAGGADLNAVNAVLDLYEEISPKRYALSGESACLLKYACNAFHATKIAFTNEISSICESLEINPVEVMDVFAQDTHLNASAAYLRPGFSFGGSCLSKDLRALLFLNQSQETSLPLLKSILPSNQCRFQKAVDAILKGEHRLLAVLGMSFKKNSDDVRDSPYVDLIETLHQNGISLKIFDPDVDFEKLKASNRALFDQRLSCLQPLMRDDLESTLADCDGIVLCKDLLESSWLQSLNISGIPIYDLGYYTSRKD